jgi:hypothetical protein
MYISSLAESLNIQQSSFAPRREELKAFGGKLTNEQFKQSCDIKPSIKLTPPMEIVKHNVETDHTVIRRDSKQPTNNEPIRLERKKPLKNSQNTLEKTMGIFLS